MESLPQRRGGNRTRVARMSATVTVEVCSPWMGGAPSPYKGPKPLRSTPARLAPAALALLLVLAGTTTATAIGARRDVIVRTLPGLERAVEREVARLGGKIGLELPIIGGFSARIPNAALPVLRADRAVVALTSNGRLTFPSTYDPSGDPYSLHNVAATIRATNLWQAGYTGAGVGVALIDSGVV